MVSLSPQSDRLDAVFSALADPTRRAILAGLAAGPVPVKKLSQPFKISAPAISKHLRVLEKAGLISRARRAQTRPCRLEAKPMKEATDWMEKYRRFWEERLDRLDDYLRQLQKEEKKNDRKKS